MGSLKLPDCPYGGEAMADIKWIKITTTMFDDEKIKLIESMPEADSILIIWIKLLTLAGRCNANGYIFLTENIPYTDEMLSTIFNRPLNTIRLALKCFKDFGMINYDEDNMLYVTNWEKHQNIEGMDRIREQTRQRVQRHRKKKAIEAAKTDDHKQDDGDSNEGVTDVTLHETLSNAIEEDKEEDIEEEGDTIESPAPSVPYEEIKDMYNNTCTSLAKVISLSQKRKKHIKARWNQFKYEIATFETVFMKVQNSSFCSGKNDRGWKADFDWLITNDTNMLKVLEGKYDNKDPTPAQPEQTVKRPKAFNFD